MRTKRNRKVGRETREDWRNEGEKRGREGERG